MYSLTEDSPPVKDAFQMPPRNGVPAYADGIMVNGKLYVNLSSTYDDFSLKDFPNLPKDHTRADVDGDTHR